jgi:hypothetical protein
MYNPCRPTTRLRAALLVAREWSILAGEDDDATDTFHRITG